MLRQMRSLGFISYGIFILLVGAAVHADNLKYSELQIKDYDEMQALVKKKTDKVTKFLRADKSEDTKADQPVVDELKAALLLVLSRPNQDNMLAKLLPDIRKEMSNLNCFEDSLNLIATDSISRVNNEKLPTVYKSTSLFVLENILAEFRPEVKDKPELRAVFEKIRDAKIQIPKDVTKDLKLRSMLKVESPSERADRILKQLK